MGRISVAVGVVIAVVVCTVGSAEQFPYVGKVTAARVNVRAGAGVAYRILKVAKEGNLVYVRGRTGDWLRIRCPEGCKAWVHSRFIKDGVVTGDSVNIRATNSTKDIVIGQLSRGDRVQILRNFHDWVQIAAPEQADAYIFGKYVAYKGTVGEFMKQERKRARVTNLQDKVEADLKRERSKPDAADWKLAPIIADYEKLKKIAGEEDLGPVSKKAAALADQRLEELAPYKELAARLKKAQDELDKIDMEIAQRKKEQMTPEETYDAKGWVEDVGPMVFRPGTHRLRMGMEPLCFLKSGKYNLYDYVGSLVGIKGEVVKRRGHKVLVVEKLDVLHADKSDF